MCWMIGTFVITSPYTIAHITFEVLVRCALSNNIAFPSEYAAKVQLFFNSLHIVYLNLLLSQQRIPRMLLNWHSEDLLYLFPRD